MFQDTEQVARESQTTPNTILLVECRIATGAALHALPLCVGLRVAGYERHRTL